MSGVVGDSVGFVVIFRFGPASLSTYLARMSTSMFTRSPTSRRPSVVSFLVNGMTVKLNPSR